MPSIVAQSVEQATTLALRGAREALASAHNYGRFGSEDAALRILVDRLVAALDPQEIWLFGSRARGEAAPDSDFDLFVVARPDGTFGSDDYLAVDRAVQDTRVGCDVVPCSAEDFTEAAAWPTTLVAEILRTGRRLYQARSTGA